MKNINFMISHKLILATNNPGKIAEITALLSDLDVELVTPADLDLKIEVLEDGQTYAENAARKASAFACASGLASLADDSGLEVDALGGKPGIHSNRINPQLDATDADRRAYLIHQLGDQPRPWIAHFYATVAVGTPDRKIQYAVGHCTGEIIPEERGRHGFGYDPIFLIPNLGRTMAELNMDEKNHLSHRAQAVKNAIPIIKRILGI